MLYICIFYYANLAMHLNIIKYIFLCELFNNINKYKLACGTNKYSQA